MVESTYFSFFSIPLDFGLMIYSKKVLYQWILFLQTELLWIFFVIYWVQFITEFSWLYVLHILNIHLLIGMIYLTSINWCYVPVVLKVWLPKHQYNLGT